MESEPLRSEVTCLSLPEDWDTGSRFKREHLPEEELGVHWYRVVPVRASPAVSLFLNTFCFSRKRHTDEKDEWMFHVRPVEEEAVCCPRLIFPRRNESITLIKPPGKVTSFSWVLKQILKRPPWKCLAWHLGVKLSWKVLTPREDTGDFCPRPERENARAAGSPREGLSYRHSLLSSCHQQFIHSLINGGIYWVTLGYFWGMIRINKVLYNVLFFFLTLAGWLINL